MDFKVRGLEWWGGVNRVRDGVRVGGELSMLIFLRSISSPPPLLKRRKKVKKSPTGS